MMLKSSLAACRVSSTGMVLGPKGFLYVKP